MKFLETDEIKPSLNITSLIDVVLLLLIFFMISTSFSLSSGLKVNLPEASSKYEKMKKPIIIVVSAQGVITVGGQTTSIEQLRKSIQSLIKKGHKKAVVINADKEVKHGLVVSIMDIVKQLEINDIAIAAIPRSIHEKRNTTKEPKTE